MSGVTDAPPVIRPPAVAGRFYADDPRQLARQVDDLLAQAAPSQGEPSIVIAPHAGYAYSGPVAAQAFKALAGRVCDGVIVLGLNHTFSAAFDGASIWLEGAWRTPLGDVPVDADLARSIAQAEPHFKPGLDAHTTEHSIEVMLPFLQRALPGRPFVPISVGRPAFDNCRALAEGLARAVAGKNVLTVASTDLSHYPAYADAVEVDRETLSAALSLDPLALESVLVEWPDRPARNLYTRMCGQGPVLTAMQLAECLGAGRTMLLRYANSGDAPAGERQQVVGYAAVGFMPGTPPAVTEADRVELLRLARAQLAAHFSGQPPATLQTDSPALHVPRAVFVTLRHRTTGALRGCRGDVFARSAVWESVRRVVLQSALADPRFPPMQVAEVAETCIEISILSPLRRVTSPDDVIVGRHGVLIRRGERRGLFLPSVPVEQGWGRDDYLDAVCVMKADLPRGAWRRPDTQLYVFETDVFEEPAP